MNTLLDELFAYVGFGGEDAARLRTLHRVLAPHFPAIAAEFYEVAISHAGTAELLADRKVDTLCTTLVDWMTSGLLGPHDETFYESRTRVGHRHIEIGLAQHYMFTAMNVIRTAYISRIAELFEPAEAFPLIRSVDKLLDIELAIILRHYQVDSEDKLVQRERRRQNDQLAAMQTLSSGLAHEIRNPLNSAKLQLELLERRLRRNLGDPRLAEPTELAHHEIQRLTELVNDFLAFAQPPTLHRAEQDLVAIASHVLELERPLANRRGVVLELATDRPAILASVDSTKVHQIIQNLVRNGIEAVAPGGHVSIAITESADRIHLRVRDDGPGIPDRVRARMYEPFYSTKESGTGLGMSIVLSLVAMHGGSIDVLSSPSGAQFEVALPRG